MPLPYDYARCGNQDGCAHANTCKRTEPGKTHATFPQGDDCYGYIPKHDVAETRRSRTKKDLDL